MARVTQFVFNIPQKETTYLYKEVFYSRNSDINNTGVANLTLKLTVRQNIDQANAYKFFNTIDIDSRVRIHHVAKYTHYIGI